jgi:phytoene dehydrogenase-like protein
MKIAIIGAGGAGLCAGRHCLEKNFSFDIFEQTGNVGGTWNYTECIGRDENGVPVHSSMYQGLRFATNQSEIAKVTSFYQQNQPTKRSDDLRGLSLPATAQIVLVAGRSAGLHEKLRKGVPNRTPRQGTY